MLGQPITRPHRTVWSSRLASRISAKTLVFSGVLLFVLYIAMDVVATLSYDGYSYKNQVISELSAIDAPTRGGWFAASIVYVLLAFAFAIGVVRVAGRRRRLHIVGWLLLAAAVVGIAWWFVPMHQREVLAADGGDWRDIGHLVVGGANSLLYFSMIAVAMFAFGRKFRWYSIVTIGLMLVFGTLMNLEAPDVNSNEPTPWLGIYERIAIEGAMLWEAVFAAVLLRSLRPTPTDAIESGRKNGKGI